MDGPDADDVDRELIPRRDWPGAVDERAHRRDIPKPQLDRLSTDRRNRAAHETVPWLADAGEARRLHDRAVGDMARGFGGLGLSEDIALDHAHSELPDELKVIVGFDAFRARIHAERFGKGDNCADDGGVPVGRAYRCSAAHEALVDLDLVERRLLQIAER
ncbi:MAG TPA: hypothetical protein VNR86_03125 [Sphingomicrobium sp.]|nr:hypothetical protein [Sphingomicrobium sp.]